MPRVFLTDIAIKAFAPPARGQTTYWEASLPGFGLRVSEGGTKTWVVVHGKDRRRITIDRYPNSR